MADLGSIRTGTPAARAVLATTVLGSGLVFLDSTVVNIALPTIGEDLGAGLAGLQWTVDAYLVTLTALLLLGGSLGDRYGRRRMFQVGLVWFTAASVLCGLAPNVGLLIAARAGQGIGGALLVPGSLALISASFDDRDRAWAIGAWSGMSGVSTAVAPFIGGWLIDAVSWRAVFFINVPSAAVALWMCRHVPESSDDSAPPKLDYAGAIIGSLALGAVVWALIESGDGVGATELGVGVAGLVGLVLFVVVEARSDHPMVRLEMFGSPQFTGANLTTFAVYGGLGGATFLVVLQLQIVLGYSALAAGASLLPMSILLLAFSPAAGRWSAKIGPRVPMTVGPLVAAVGLAWFATIDANTAFLPHVFGAATVFGVGLVLTVSPLTTTVLTAVEVRLSGVASGVNNAVARGAGLLAVAFLPAVAGLSTDAPPGEFTGAYRLAVRLCAVLCVLGGAVAFATIRNPHNDLSPNASR